MARSIFMSFHYQRDLHRVNVVRMHYVTKGTYTDAGYWDHSLWESTKARGDDALKRLIEDGLKGTSVTVVLIGAETASRPWVTYEIQRSYVLGNGLLGIYINSIRDMRTQATDIRGPNPLSALFVTVDAQRVPLSHFYSTYDWVADNGYVHFGEWVEAAANAAGR